MMLVSPTCQREVSDNLGGSLFGVPAGSSALEALQAPAGYHVQRWRFQNPQLLANVWASFGPSPNPSPKPTTRPAGYLADPASAYQ